MPESLQVTSKRTCFGMVRFLLLLALLVSFSLGVLMLAGNRPYSDDPAEVDKVIRVLPGMSARSIAQLLEDEKLIADATVFRIMAKLVQAEGKLQAGHYLLNAQMETLEIIKHLRKGTVFTIRVVISEGFEIKQIAAALAQKGLVDPERFKELATNGDLVFGDQWPIDSPIASLEGYLFPDTYYFSPGQTEEEIISQMVKRFVELTDREIGPLLVNSPYSLHEVTTLASIVEREIMVDFERPLVASVYLNRLAIQMPLQADPTVRYVTPEERPIVLYKDLEIDSPYNTYRNYGLPPGPIGSPGLASMRAVLNPAETKYLFFVSKRDGTHEFTETYAEHLKARRSLGY